MEARRIPPTTTLRKLRKRYNISVHEAAASMGVEDNYLERMEDRGDCLVSEFRRYAAAIKGDARCSIKVPIDDALYVIDLGFRPRHEEVPEVHGVDMPRLPSNTADLERFEEELKRIDDNAYTLTSDRDADRKERAMAFSARESVSLLRKVAAYLRPRLAALEDMQDLLHSGQRDKGQLLDRLSGLITDE